MSKLVSANEVDILNGIGLMTNVKKYEKIHKLVIGKPYIIEKFYRAASRYGDGKSLIAELVDMKIYLPNRFNIKYDTAEKLQTLNAMKLRIIYDGMQGRTPLLRFERLD